MQTVSGAVSSGDSGSTSCIQLACPGNSFSFCQIMFFILLFKMIAKITAKASSTDTSHKITMETGIFLRPH
uniref:Uncharacterized protein n=1 Tax=Anguilla anguilla TaxID=7936 RepID=A0A0E9XY90_ANGAN